MDSLNFGILSIYDLTIKLSLKLFHFLYLLAATWVLKTGFGIAIVIFSLSIIWLEFECVSKIHFPYSWHCWINPKTGIVLRKFEIRSLRSYALYVLPFSIHWFLFWGLQNLSFGWVKTILVFLYMCELFFTFRSEPDQYNYCS